MPVDPSEPFVRAKAIQHPDGRDGIIGIGSAIEFLNSEHRDAFVDSLALPSGPGGGGGTTWRSGSGAPSDGTGADGDFYLRTSNGAVYKRTSGTYSVIANLTGPTGAAGATGATGNAGASTAWRHGIGAPSNALGNDGDYYLRTSNGDVYYRTAGVYAVTANLTGPVGATGATGAAGATGDTGATGAAGADGSDGADGTDGADGSDWLAGNGTPDNSLGADDDLYLDVDTGNVLRRASGTWGLIGNIKGADGADGVDGVNGSDGSDGSDGADGAIGQGVPTGGTTGQVLVKSSATDFDTAWEDKGDMQGRALTNYLGDVVTESGSFTLSSSHLGKIVRNAATVTVPSSLPVGFTCTICASGGDVTFVAGSGATIHSDGLTLEQHRHASVLCSEAIGEVSLEGKLT